jgi:hypothetical protein
MDLQKRMKHIYPIIHEITNTPPKMKNRNLIEKKVIPSMCWFRTIK